MQVYSRIYSRPFRVAVILTSTLVLMFTNALLYTLLYPDVSHTSHGMAHVNQTNIKAVCNDRALCACLLCLESNRATAVPTRPRKTA